VNIWTCFTTVFICFLEATYQKIVAILYELLQIMELSGFPDTNHVLYVTWFFNRCMFKLIYTMYSTWWMSTNDYWRTFSGFKVKLTAVWIFVVCCI
jgi:hypothetical protein